jgi:hypothetical protein
MRMIPAEVLGCRCGPRYQGGKNKRLLEWEKKGTQKEQRKKARNQRRQRKTLERAFFCRPSSPSPSFALPRPLLLFSLALPLSFSFSFSLSLSLYSLSLSPTPLCVPRRPSRPGRRRAAAPRRQHLVGARDKVGLARRPAGVASAGVGSGGGPVSVGVLAPAAPRGGPAPRLLRRRRRRRRERRGGRGRACGGAAPRRDRRDDVGHRRVRDLRGPPPVAPRRVGPLRHPAVA